MRCGNVDQKKSKQCGGVGKKERKGEMPPGKKVCEDWNTRVAEDGI